MSMKVTSSQNSVAEVELNKEVEIIDMEVESGRNVNIQNIVEDGPLAKKSRRMRYGIHESFSQEPVTRNGITQLMWKCKHCSSTHKIISSGATSHLNCHRDHDCLFQLSMDKKQKTLTFSEPSSELQYLNTITASSTFDNTKARELIAKWIMVHEHSFSIVEEFLFNIMLKYFNPSYIKVSRATIRNDCLKIFSFEKDSLKKFLSEIETISLTIDTWTSSTTTGFMCLTAHFVDSNWKLQKRILNFCELDPPHTGIVIADAIMNCLVEWEIDHKVLSLTLDNASTNDVVVRTLMDTLNGRGCLFFEGKFFHVRCCAHILNIMVQDGLHVIQSCISNIRESVKYMKKNPMCLKKFGDIAKQLNISTSRDLTQDVSTRWNSTFLMLDAAIYYKSVFQNYARRDNNYKWLPSDEEWEKATKLHPILKQFFEVTNVFSSYLLPTSNVFLPKIWKVVEILKEKADLDDEFIKEITSAMKKKFDKYWKKCSLVMSISTILDPRYKFKAIEFIFQRMHGLIEAQEHLTKLKTDLSSIYESYYIKVGTHKDKTKNISQSNDIFSEMTSEAELDKYLDNIESESPEVSDLDRYLEESILRSRKGDTSFDVLDWWKSNSLKFPVLSILARDILSIPISSVASESAFSAGGRVLTDYRSLLTSKNVEAIICTTDWIRANIKDCILNDRNSQDESMEIKILD